MTPLIKKEMDDSDMMKEQAAETGLIDDYNLYKKKRNKVTILLKTAEKVYHDKKFGEESFSKTVWRTAYDVFGNQRTSFPSQILHWGRLLSNPKVIAAEVNQFFVDKIRQLKKEFASDDTEDPTIELKKFLSKINIPRDGFNLKELDDVALKGKSHLAWTGSVVTP